MEYASELIFFTLRWDSLGLAAICPILYKILYLTSFRNPVYFLFFRYHKKSYGLQQEAATLFTSPKPTSLTSKWKCAIEVTHIWPTTPFAPRVSCHCHTDSLSSTLLCSSFNLSIQIPARSDKTPALLVHLPGDKISSDYWKWYRDCNEVHQHGQPIAPSVLSLFSGGFLVE